VYGAGYLVQRTIVMATLFSLLSMIAYAHGLTRRANSGAILAAFFYTLAVFSKEHSLLLPAAMVMMTPLLTQDRRYAVRYARTFLAACLPAAITIILLLRGVVGTTYEPQVEVMFMEQSGVPELAVAGGAWLVSIISQCGLFFQYLAAWLVPDTAAMSIDIRVEYMHSWSLGWIALKLLAFVTFGALAFFLIFRRSRMGLLGFGLFYFWIVFCVELSAVRFQEPFVLYRSYLWAPGLIVAVIALLSALPRKAVLPIFILVAPVLFYQAHDRLRTFSGNLALWADAAARLSAAPVPLGWRPLTNLAREQTHAGHIGQAVETIDRCLSLYPKASRCHFARGAIHNYKKQHVLALRFLDQSIAINPMHAVAYFQRGVALEGLGRIEEADAAYLEASERGYFSTRGDRRLSKQGDRSE
jgi:hypothetical protein